MWYPADTHWVSREKTIVGISSHYYIFRNAYPLFWPVTCPPFTVWKWTHVWTKTWYRVSSIHLQVSNLIYSVALKQGHQMGALNVGLCYGGFFFPWALTMFLAKELGQEAQAFHTKEQSEGPGKIPSPTCKGWNFMVYLKRASFSTRQEPNPLFQS